MKLKITEKTKFPITEGNWKIWLQRGNLLIYNSIFRDPDRATIVIPFSAGTLFLPKKGMGIQFTSIEEERWLSANNLSYVIRKSPNGYYNLDENHDFMITDGVFEWFGDHNKLKVAHIEYNMFVNNATYVILKHDEHYTLQTDKRFTELILPTIRKRMVCGYCNNYSYKTNKCGLYPERLSIVPSSTSCEKNFVLSKLFVIDCPIDIPVQLEEWN